MVDAGGNGNGEWETGNGKQWRQLGRSMINKCFTQADGPGCADLGLSGVIGSRDVAWVLGLGAGDGSLV